MADVFHRVLTKAGINKYHIDLIEFEELVDAFSRPKNKKELSQFLKDLLTKREIAELIRRWLVARMLYDELTYEEIFERTGMSPSTVAGISDRLENESSILERILERTGHLRNKDVKRRRKEAVIAETPDPIDRKFRRMVEPFYEG